MASITIKDIPEVLHQRLKERAKANRRSLNAEVIACLEAKVLSRPVDMETELERIKQLREEVGGYLTQEMLDEFKEEGRRH